jgi:hypothetical protein
LLPGGAQAVGRTIAFRSSVSHFSIWITSALGTAFPSVASRYSATDRLLDGHPGSIEPDHEVGDLLNGLVNPRRQLVLLILHLMFRSAQQIECQLPLLIAKVDLAGRAHHRYHDELAMESPQTFQANRVNLRIEEGRTSSRKAEKGRRSG